MGFSNATPMMTAGMNATTSEMSSRRPSASRPNTPWIMLMMRRRYRTSTARIAPNWIAMA